MIKPPKPIFDGLEEFIFAVEKGEIDPTIVGVRVQKDYIIGEICDENKMYYEYENSIQKDEDTIYTQIIFKENGTPTDIIEKFLNYLNVSSYQLQKPY